MSFLEEFVRRAATWGSNNVYVRLASDETTPELNEFYREAAFKRGFPSRRHHVDGSRGSIPATGSPRQSWEVRGRSLRVAAHSSGEFPA